MNTNQYTQKSLEAIDRAQKMALENNNMQIEQEHLFYALLDQDGGLIPQLFMKMDVDTDDFLAVLDQLIVKIPQVSVPVIEPVKIYISPAVDKTFLAAKKEAENERRIYFGRTFDVGHFDVACRRCKRRPQRYGIDVGSFCERCNPVRGSNRVTSDTPEDTYEALKMRVRFGGESREQS